MEFQFVKQDDKKDSEYFYERGTNYLIAQEFDQAIDDLEHALTGAPKNIPTLVNLSAAYAQTGRTKESLQTIEKARSIAPDNPQVLVNLAGHYANLKRNEEALHVLLEVDKLAPDDPQIQTKIALGYLFTEKRDKAREWFMKSRINEGKKSSIEDLNPVVLGEEAKGTMELTERNRKLMRRDYLLHLLRDQGFPDEMFTIAKETLTINKDNLYPLAVLGDWHKEHQHYKKALSAYNHLLRKNYGKKASLEKAIGHCHEKLKNYQEALKHYLKAERHLPEDAELHSDIGTTYFYIHQPEAGLPYHRRAMQLDGESIHVLKRYIITLNHLHKIEESEIILNKAYRIAPQDSSILTSLGQLHHLKKDYAKSIMYAKKALEINPKAIDPKIILVKDYTSTEQFAQALQTIDQLLTQEPENINFMVDKGLVLNLKAEYQVGIAKEETRKEALDILTTAVEKAETRYTFYGLASHHFREGHHHLALQFTGMSLSKPQPPVLMRVFGEQPQNVVKWTMETLENPHHLFETVLESYQAQPSRGLGEVLLIYLDYLRDDTASQSVAKDILTSITDNTLKNMNEKQSRNPVKIDITTPYSQNLFVIKTNDKEKPIEEERKRLHKEYSLSTIIYDALVKADLEAGKIIATPFHYSEKDQEIQFIEKRIRKPTLEIVATLADGNHIMEELLLAAKSLALFSTIGTQAINSYEGLPNLSKEELENYVRPLDLMNNLQKRMIKTGSRDRYPRLGTNPALEPFLESYQEIINSLTPLDFLIPADLYATNVISGGTLIDLEKTARGDPTTDLSQLLSNPLFNGLPMRLVIDHFKDTFLEYGGRQEDIQAMQHNFPFSNLNNHIIHVGVQTAQGNFKKAQYHLHAASQIMAPHLREQYLNYIKETKQEHLTSIIR